MPAPQPKPKYILKGPRQERVVRNVYSKSPERDEDGSILKTEDGKNILGPLEYKPVETVQDCWMLFMPSGPNNEFNSIRITSLDQLQELGIDPNHTPLVDEDGNTVGSFPNRVNQDYGPDPVLTTRAKKGAE